MLGSRGVKSVNRMAFPAHGPPCISRPLPGSARLETGTQPIAIDTIFQHNSASLIAIAWCTAPSNDRLQAGATQRPLHVSLLPRSLL